MPAIKQLGRGLDSLIAGGAKPGPEAAPPEEAAAKKKKSKPRPIPKKREAQPPPAAENPLPAAAPPGFAEIPVDAIDPNPRQPRKETRPAQLAELAESIRSEGLLQPILARRKGARYELIAGERRWRACRSLGLKSIPAHLMDAGDASAAVISMIENLQRADLNPIEEALGYASLMSDFGLTQEAVSERVGKSRPAIANTLRLISLHREVQGYLAKGLLSAGHAKALLTLEDPAQQLLLARRVIEEERSVRETERLAAQWKTSRVPVSRNRPVPAAESGAVKDLEKRISSHFNTPVQLRHAAKKGRLIFEYFGNDDLRRILEKMGVG